ncbi:unnamed protein product [Adineta ricciae]|uniref:Uncharacterized protein n=1 Tax=Adineta ricciae TaxID=249248 RepID=A0A813ZFJ5_ADIRI|nr:unnamed protein product [Adineta ricciae]
MSNSNVGETVVLPAIGQIHSRHISVAKLFGVKAGSQASALSSTSSKSSSNKAKPRPCLIWRTSPFVQVLVMSRFDGVDVTDVNNHFMDHLPRDYVLKRLIAVHDKEPLGNRRTIKAAGKETPLITINTYLVLIPTMDEDTSPYKQSNECFPTEELQYIYSILLQIHNEENEEQMRMLQQSHPLPAYNSNDDVNKDEDRSSSNSSLPIPRRQIHFVEIDVNKNNYIKQWLNDCE